MIRLLIAAQLSTSSYNLWNMPYKVTADTYKRAWSRFVTGVSIITTGTEDDLHGMTANGIASVSLEPPLALVSVDKRRNTHDRIISFTSFGISILKVEDEPVAVHFASPAETRPDTSPDLMRRLGGSMVITNALAAFDCRVISTCEVVDHTIFIGETEAAFFSDGTPLLWNRSRFDVPRADPSTLCE